MLVQYTVNSTWDSTKPYLNQINISWAPVNYIVCYWYHVVYRLSCMVAVCVHCFYGKELWTLLELIRSTISTTRIVTVMVTDVMMTVMVRMMTVDLNDDIILYMYASRSGCHKQLLAEVGVKKLIHQTKIAAAVNSQYTPSSLASLSSSSVNMWRLVYASTPQHSV